MPRSARSLPSRAGWCGCFSPPNIGAPRTGLPVRMPFAPNEERTGPVHALFSAVNMLLHTDEGDMFTFGEMSQWLRDAGFVNPRLLEAPAPSPLLLADKTA